MIALIIQTWAFYRSSSQIIYAQARQTSLSAMQSLQEDLYTLNKAVENSLIKLYNNTDFIQDLADAPSADALGDYNQVAYDMAHSAFTPSQNLVALYIYTPGHELVSSYQHAQTPIYAYPETIFDERYPSDTQLIVSYIESDNRVMLLTSYYNPNRKVNLIRYVLSIYRNTTDTIGYIVCDIDPKPYKMLIEKYRYSEDQVIWLQPAGDQTVLQLGALPPAQQELYETLSVRIAEGKSDVDMNGYGEYEFFSVAERKYNVKAYSLMPQHLLAMNQQALLSNFILLLLAILISVILLFLLVSNSLTKPLRYVVETMKQITQGDTYLRLKPMKQDEIGQLGQEFNAMLDETERLIKQEYEARLLANEARYKALQAQVNPHFLYNTLDTMSGIATSQNCPTVSTLSKALSNIFRYGLEMDRAFSTLAQEILHIKNYMYIMNVRMNHTVELKIAIESDMLSYELPRLSIQPLVENAIQHGLQNKRGGKCVRIGAEREDATLRIWVEDNGIGMDADAMNERLLHSLDNALTKNASIGIDNINARVKLVYGGMYGVHVSSTPGEGSRVTLSIPAKRSEVTGDA